MIGPIGAVENFATELGQLADEESRELILALDDAGILGRDYFDPQDYLQDMNNGFRPEQPPEPYDLRKDYRQSYEVHQQELRREAERKRKERKSRVRQVVSRPVVKIGRNDPCPCGRRPGNISSVTAVLAVKGLER